MRVSTSRFLWLSFAFCLAATAQAQADDPLDDQARAHFEAAQAHFDTGGYEDAIREFDQAYRLSGRAQLLYNLYLCHERLGNLSVASDHLLRYLDADPEAPHAAALRIRLANLQRRAAASQPNSERGAVNVPAVTKPVTHVADSAPVEPEGRGNAKVITALSLGGAGLVSFGVFAFMSKKQDAELDSSCADACADREVKDLRTYSLVADISLGIGVTGLVVGGAFWWASRRRSSPQALSVMPVLGREHLGLSAEGRF